MRVSIGTDFRVPDIGTLAMLIGICYFEHFLWVENDFYWKWVFSQSPYTSHSSLYLSVHF